MGAFVIVVSALMVATAWFRRDVPMIQASLSELSPLLDWRYFLFVIAQQTFAVWLFFSLQQAKISEQASLVVVSILFGALGHFGNRGLQGWCAAMGAIYLTMWSEFHNVIPLILGHFLLSKVYRRFSPETYNEGMVVWRR